MASSHTPLDLLQATQAQTQAIQANRNAGQLGWAEEHIKDPVGTQSLPSQIRPKLPGVEMQKLHFRLSSV
jgi:hypothetical protein